MKRFLIPFVLGPAALASACSEAPELGSASFPLTDAAFFRLRIYESAGLVPSDDTVFDTGCIQRQSRTYELTNIPVGTGYVVYYEGFTAASCDAAARVEDGYRGGVTITKADQPYYHVPVYPVGAVASLPENLNLSASVATAVDFCDGPEDCGSGQICYDAAKPQYWCVPSCGSDADCSGLHPRATCDLATSWCMLRSPYPLNLSEPRALGAAVTTTSGDVLFVGGLRERDAGGFGPTEHWLERFDARAGLLAPAEVTGASDLPAGMFGFADLGGDRFVAVGGVHSLDGLTFDADEGLVPDAEWSQALVASATVFEPGAGRAKSSALVRGVMQATVVPLGSDRFWMAGGLVAAGGSIEATKATSICTIDDGLAVTCGASVQLKAPRFAAAAACLDAACSRILLVGGNLSDVLGEVIDFGANTAEALEVQGFGGKAFMPVLCGFDLVGGSGAATRAAPFAPVRLAVSGKSLVATPIEGAAPSVFFAGVAPAGDGCVLAGGLGASGDALTTVQMSGADGFHAVDGATLGQGRAGAATAVVGAGPLAGRVVFAGGFAIVPGGPTAVAVRGLEVYTP